MNENQFMGFRIRYDCGGCANSAMQSIRGASDSEVEMNERQSIHGATNKI